MNMKISRIISVTVILGILTKLGKIKIPLLIIRGQCDNQAWGFTKEYLDLFVNAEFEMVEDAGHDLINEDRSKYFELISGYLSVN